MTDLYKLMLRIYKYKHNDFTLHFQIYGQYICKYTIVVNIYKRSDTNVIQYN